MESFLEKIQNVHIYHNDSERTPLAVAYDFNKFPTQLEVIIEVKLLNIKVDKEYVIAVSYIESRNLNTLHLLNNVLLEIPEADMIKVKDGYGLAYGDFLTSIPVEHPTELELYFELRAVDDMEVILDSFKTYLVFGGKE
ncbi:hypothetical protein [Streptococcus pluranimalium]|uniref:hypothetical protein n=1 Tax=Streptococcus pluranimalium TaxID=82348 RepID=UPI003F68D69E